MVKPINAITLRLDEEFVEKLERVKKHYGLKTDTETLRLCINDADRIVEERNKIFQKFGGKTD